MRKRSKVGLLLVSLAPWVLLGLTPQFDRKSWTLDQWTQWRDSQIQRILEPTFHIGDDWVLSRQEVVNRSAEAQKAFADSAILSDPKRKQILGNFARFTRAVGQMSVDGHLLAMDIPDREYFDYVSPVVQFPELLRSQAFLKCMSDRATYRDAVRMIEAQNATLPESQGWIVFPFRAQFIKSVDSTTYGRMLVLIPNQKLPDGQILDQWIMFAIATPDQAIPPNVRSISFVATVRDPSHAGVSKGYFSDFMREKDAATGEIRINPNFLMKDSPSKNCYDCHKTAVLPIHPKNAFRFEPAGAMVTAETPAKFVRTVEALIEKYGKTEFGHLDPASYGPSLGPDIASRSDEWIAESAKDTPLTPASVGRVRSSMNCSGCHDGFAKIDSWLALRTDQEVKSFEAKKGLVQSLIEEGLMPPNNTLTKDERHALWECLMKEYYDFRTRKGLLVDWLRGG